MSRRDEEKGEGTAINPHIPQYIAKAPWYISQNAAGGTLKHQESTASKFEVDINQWYKRGEKAGPAATKFRKGACTNCGAMTHSAKFCCERPRKLGAKWTGKNIQADEVIVDNIDLDFDGKRDRWNGYQPEVEFEERLEFYNKMEQERRRKKKEEELNSFMTEPDPDQARYPHTKEGGEGKKPNTLVDSDSSDSDSDDEDKSDFIDKNQAAVGVKKDAKTRTTVRNLRIREDTAKYLRNLDPDSAAYDPKSRSMRENPTPHIKDAIFTGDANFVRASEDVSKFTEFRAFSYTAYEKGEELHMQGAPSAAELRFRSHKEGSVEQSKKTKDDILKKYGGQEHLAVPKDIAMSQSEDYVEYRFDGTVLRGKETGVPKSKYEEDVIVNNHTQVWGSYYEDGQWGYGCCRNLVKNSYCTGKAGIAAKVQATESAQESKEEKDQPSDPKQDKSKEVKFQKSEKKEFEQDDRKRPYNSFKDNYEVTPEEMEAYMQKKKRSEDPMREFVN